MVIITKSLRSATGSICVAGKAEIARNHITEAEGLEAVKFCEDLVTRIYSGDLDEAHTDAIRLTVQKFKLHPEFPSSH